MGRRLASPLCGSVLFSDLAGPPTPSCPLQSAAPSQRPISRWDGGRRTPNRQRNEIYPSSVSSLRLRLFGYCQLLQGGLQEPIRISSEGTRDPVCADHQ